MRKTTMILPVLIVLTAVMTGCYDQSGTDDYRSAVQKVTVQAWPEGKIPYSFDAAFPERDTDYMKLAMEEWAQYCNIEFIDYTGREDRPERTLVIDYNDGPAIATVGYTEHPRLGVPLEDKLYQRHYVMLFGHIIGLLKEHQRPDRDKYIIMHWENINPAWISQYEKLDSTLIDEEDFVYDTASVMHYTRTQGSLDFGLRCFDYASGEDYTRAYYVSQGDAEKASFIYGPPAEQ